LSIDDNGAPYSLHGFNAVFLPIHGWYRIDPRGNRPGVNAQFSPPQERLAFSLQFPEEADFPTILPQPLDVVVTALHAQSTWEAMLHNLPDVSLDEAEALGLPHSKRSATSFSLSNRT
jgi:transglutaminase-like putative cysteine protease